MWGRFTFLPLRGWLFSRCLLGAESNPGPPSLCRCSPRVFQSALHPTSKNRPSCPFSPQLRTSVLAVMELARTGLSKKVSISDTITLKRGLADSRQPAVVGRERGRPAAGEGAALGRRATWRIPTARGESAFGTGLSAGGDTFTLLWPTAASEPDKGLLRDFCPVLAFGGFIERVPKVLVTNWIGGGCADISRLVGDGASVRVST